MAGTGGVANWPAALEAVPAVAVGAVVAVLAGVAGWFGSPPWLNRRGFVVAETLRCTFT